MRKPDGERRNATKTENATKLSKGEEETFMASGLRPRSNRMRGGRWGLRQAPARRRRRRWGDETLGFVYRVSDLNGPSSGGLEKKPNGLLFLLFTCNV